MEIGFPASQSTQGSDCLSFSFTVVKNSNRKKDLSVFEGRNFLANWRKVIKMIQFNKNKLTDHETTEI